ncbi:SAC3 domain-containing protein 1 [Toxorhynchites rutilus septentrionalis]|uniref:SAC3 domain-containing protein 1 n=1 Tax=Toxorhynchites rutilus septentrionalis TaxID=329112 RepID=UPI00247A1FFA|nr:SAC3 domain-containing protein 1 [Toxorhynchites rutilus septentrionalis]
MEIYIRGSCDTMCPKSEVEMRTREKLLHFYERKLGSKTEPDLARVIKEFARSAAGVRQPKHWEIRTVRTLKRTVQYLLSDVFQDTRRPYAYKYEFIFDRLRAVRQEVVMQDLNAVETLDILEPIVRFLAYSAYELCEHHISEYDPKICSTHLQECLKKVLRCYDDLDDQLVSYDAHRRINMESIYLTFNLGSPEALTRGIGLRKDLKEKLKTELLMNVEYLRCNFHKVLAQMRILPPLAAAVASLKLPEMRRQLLFRFSHAFHSKALTVPLEWIAHVLHYQDRECEELIEDCKHYNLELGEQKALETHSSDERVISKQREPKDNWWDDSFEQRPATERNELIGRSVKFEKTRFDCNKLTRQPRRVEFVDRKLNELKSISGMLLDK